MASTPVKHPEPDPHCSPREEYDERWARWMREEFGRKRWILSWQRLGEGRGWLARLSCPEHPETVEVDGQSRCHAIGRAHRALEAILIPARREAQRKPLGRS